MVHEFPELKRHLWSDGYFVRTVGDNVTTDVVRRYIQYHNHDMKQLSLFESY
jgi:putative transposase